MDEFNPIDVPDLSIESLLGSLELDEMKQNIEGQITGELASSQNFLSIVISKFDTLVEQIEDNDTLHILKLEIIDFCRDLLEKFSSEYNLYVEATTDDSLEYIKILTTLYQVLIISAKGNVQNFLINYIQKNKRPIIDSLDIGGRSNDVTTNANKRRNLDKDNIAILSNINEIIQFIRDADVESGEFVQLIDDGDVYTHQMNDYMMSGIVDGNFVGHLLNITVDEYDGSSSTEIRNNIRMAFNN